MGYKLNSTTAITRLTALWALNESALGGVLHAFRSPFTGLIVGGIAVIIVSMICHISNNNWKALISSLIIVLIIKMGVSPHASLTAYLAVSFQAIAGIFIFSVVGNKLLASLIFASIAILESALQKLIMLTIIYGQGIWEALDNFGVWIAGQFGQVIDVSASYVFVLVYLGINFLGSLWVGSLVYKLINRFDSYNGVDFSLTLQPGMKLSVNKASRKSFRKRILAFLIILIAVGVFLFVGQDGNQLNRVLFLAIRALSIIIIWFFFLGPFVLKHLKTFLSKRKENLYEEIDEVSSLIPYLGYIVKYCWLKTKDMMPLMRIPQFITELILTSIYFNIEDDHTNR